MNCPCGNDITERAQIECRRVRIPSRCSRCLCEFLMTRKERQRQGARKGRAVTVALRRARAAEAKRHSLAQEPAVIQLVRSLSFKQLALFDRWQMACVRVGVPLTYEEKYSYLKDLKRAA